MKPFRVDKRKRPYNSKCNNNTMSKRKNYKNPKFRKNNKKNHNKLGLKIKIL